MSIQTIIKGNPKFKHIVHRLLIPKGEARPRLWVKWLVNPLLHKKGSGARIRWNTRIDVLPFNKFVLGKNLVIEDFSTINNGVGDVFIGDNLLIGMGNVIIGPVNIGNNVILAQNVVCSGLNHGYKDVNVPIQFQPVSSALITINDDCWIGANVVITAGVTIGKHSVIAGGAVVTKNIPDYSVAVGNPAKVIKFFDFESKNWVSK